MQENDSPQDYKPKNIDSGLEQKVIQIVQQYLKGSAFQDRKLTDTPTDALSVVNRKFVTQNGTTAQRPISSVVGLQFFDTTLGYPIYKNINTNWVNSVGSVLG